MEDVGNAVGSVKGKKWGWRRAGGWKAQAAYSYWDVSLYLYPYRGGPRVAMATVSIPPRPQRYVRNDSQLANSIPGALMRVGCRERHHRVPFVHSIKPSTHDGCLPCVSNTQGATYLPYWDKLVLVAFGLRLCSPATRSGRWDSRVFVICHWCSPCPHENLRNLETLFVLPSLLIIIVNNYQ